jgi:hypothetical protein
MEMRFGTVALTMHATHTRVGRTMRHDGTRGPCVPRSPTSPEINAIDHGSREVERIDIGEFELLGHGGETWADAGAARCGDDGARRMRACACSHEVAWAERSRLTRRRAGCRVARVAQQSNWRSFAQRGVRGG